MTLSLKDEAAIVGIGETKYVRGEGSGMSPLKLILTAAVTAIRDAGLAPNEADGFMTPMMGVSAEDFAANLGVENLRYATQVNMGGASSVASMQSAAMAVASGIADYVVVPNGWNGYSGMRAREIGNEGGGDFPMGATLGNYYVPFGVNAPPQFYSIMARRHMHVYDWPQEALGNIAVAMRKHAQLNEKAYMRGRPMTLDDYKNSPWISAPYRLLDCCLETDGAAAVVVTTADRARDLAHDPVYIGGFSYGCGPGANLPFTNWPEHAEMFPKYIADKAYTMAGLGPADVDFAEIYDAFTFGVICQLEDLGFVEKGMGGPFVADGNTKLGGKLPVNLNGGLLSEAYVHGFNNMVEAVRQLRREAGERQVKDAEVGLVTGFGGAIGSVMLLHR